MSTPRGKWTWGWGLLAAAAVLLVTVALFSPRGRTGELSLTAFTEALRRGQVETAVITAQNGTAQIEGRLRAAGSATGAAGRAAPQGTEYRTRTLPADPAIALAALQAAGVSVTYAPAARLNVLTLVSGLLTLALIGGLVMLLMRRNSGGNDAAGQFGKSKAAIVSEGQIKLSFAD
ncbi:ATP-dependent metallopeptidase FtsH/Yme1/Tma family protein, partial [Deinococcus petrolearius]